MQRISKDTQARVERMRGLFVEDAIAREMSPNVVLGIRQMSFDTIVAWACQHAEYDVQAAIARAKTGTQMRPKPVRPK